jgi:amino acid transporter
MFESTMFESTFERIEHRLESFKEEAQEVVEHFVETVENSELLESFSPYGIPHQEENGDYHHHIEYPPTIDEEASVHSKQRAIGTIQLAVIVFYSVSGGPFGIEEAVRAGGAFYTLAGLLLLPLVWSIPEALITAELGSAFPEASGEVAWVEAAFGKKAAWMSGYLTWVSGVTDNSIYPCLFLAYLLRVLSLDINEIDPFIRFGMIATLAIVLGYVNWSGLPVVGELSVSICILSMSPFLLFCIFSFTKIDPSNWMRMPEHGVTMDDDDDGQGLLPAFVLGGVMWRPFLNNMFWNLNSFDSAASFAGEVHDPGIVFPKAMLISVVLVVLGYFIPMLFILGASDAPQSAWVDGYLATVAFDVIGPWLGAWTVFAAGISNIALFQAEMSSDAFQLMGMADRGYIPKVLGTRSRHGTPTYGIFIGTLIVVVMGVSDMSSLIEMLNFSYSISLLMEFAAFIKLRISQPEIDRPYQIPLNTIGCSLMLTPTVLLNLLVMSMATVKTYVFSLGVLIVGGLLYCFGVRQQIEENLDENGVEVTVEEVTCDEKSTLISIHKRRNVR